MKKIFIVMLTLLLTFVSFIRTAPIYADDYPTLNEINSWCWSLYLPPTYSNALEECKKIIIQKGTVPLDADYRPIDNLGSGAISAYRDGDNLIIVTDADKFNVTTNGEGHVFGYSSGNLFKYFYTIENLDMISIPEGSITTYMFENLGSESQDPIDINFNCLDTSNVVDAKGLFKGIGINTEKSITLDVDSMNTSKMENMSEMFKEVGANTLESIQIDLSSWDVSKVKNMKEMFAGFAQKSSSPLPLNLSSWDVSNVENMQAMFFECAQSQSIPINVDLSSWDVSSVKTMNSMFTFFGRQTTSPISLNISTWDVSNVEDMAGMFNSLGRDSQTAPQLDLSSWDVSSVKTMSNMFASYASNSFTPVSLDLSSWDVSSVEDMSMMFNGFAGNAAAPVSLDLSSWDVSNVNVFDTMFGTINPVEANINLSNWTIKDEADTKSMFSFVTSDECTGTIKLNLSNWKNLNDNSNKFCSLFAWGSGTKTINNPNLTIDLSGYGAVANGANPFMYHPSAEVNETLAISNIGKLIIPNRTKILNVDGEVIGYKENSPTRFYYNETDYAEFDDSLPVYLAYDVNYHIGNDATTTEGAPLSGIYIGDLLIDDFVGGKNSNLLKGSDVKRNGYSFKGWYDNPGLTGKPVTTVDISSFDTKDYIDLYAKWEAKSGSNNEQGHHVVLNTGIN